MSEPSAQIGKYNVFKVLNFLTNLCLVITYFFLAQVSEPSAQIGKYNIF